MKIVSVEVTKVGIGKFYPKENKVELKIDYDDGNPRHFLKTVDVTTPEESSKDIVSNIIAQVTDINKSHEKTYVDSLINIVIQNQEKVIEQIGAFIQKINSQLEKINEKKDVDGYLDIIRDLKSMHLVLI